MNEKIKPCETCREIAHRSSVADRTSSRICVPMPFRYSPRIAFVILALIAATAATAQTDEPDSALLNALYRDAADSTIARLSSQSILLVISPSHGAQRLHDVFRDRCAALGRAVVTDARMASECVTLRLSDCERITASSGDSSYLARASMSLVVTVETLPDRHTTWSHTFRLSRTDTIGTAHGERDAASADFIDDIVAPVVASIAALAIVIVFFTVRGSS